MTDEALVLRQHSDGVWRLPAEVSPATLFGETLEEVSPGVYYVPNSLLVQYTSGEVNDLLQAIVDSYRAFNPTATMWYQPLWDRDGFLLAFEGNPNGQER